jgi:hypothetical protein
MCRGVTCATQGQASCFFCRMAARSRPKHPRSTCSSTEPRTRQLLGRAWPSSRSGSSSLSKSPDPEVRQVHPPHPAAPVARRPAHHYLQEHPRGTDPTAPLIPGREKGGCTLACIRRRPGVPHRAPGWDDGGASPSTSRSRGWSRTPEQRGVTFHGPVVDEGGGLALAFFADPDGNPLYLAETLAGGEGQLPCAVRRPQS